MEDIDTITSTTGIDQGQGVGTETGIAAMVTTTTTITMVMGARLEKRNEYFSVRLDSNSSYLKTI